MAQQPQVPTYYDTEKDVVDRLSKFKGDFNYHAQASLPVLSQAIEEVKAAANDVDVAAAPSKRLRQFTTKKLPSTKPLKRSSVISWQPTKAKSATNSSFWLIFF